MERDLGIMYDFIERLDPQVEFADALDLSRKVMAGVAHNDKEALYEYGVYVYPKLRFLLVAYERYKFAANFIGSDDFVLDVPCGIGYGSAYLASIGCNVLGIDIDKESIDVAKYRYNYPNVEFLVGDMMEIDLPRSDVIVCAEGLEHVSPGGKLLERFVESLGPGGTLIVTVPINEDVIRPDKHNPYHLEDYTLDSFRELLDKHFSHVDIFGFDTSGSVSDVAYAFDGLIAVCEV